LINYSWIREVIFGYLYVGFTDVCCCCCLDA
jgi:hypothetical protein